jgi:hypothetical protein
MVEEFRCTIPLNWLSKFQRACACRSGGWQSKGRVTYGQQQVMASQQPQGIASILGSRRSGALPPNNSTQIGTLPSQRSALCGQTHLHSTLLPERCSSQPMLQVRISGVKHCNIAPQAAAGMRRECSIFALAVQLDSCEVIPDQMRHMYTRKMHGVYHAV